MNILNSFMDFSGKAFLDINGFVISWYSVCILTGIIIAAVMGIKEAKRFGISSNYITDGVLICVPLSIIGARLYYVLFAWNQFYVKGDFGKTFLNILGFDDSGFHLQGLSITGGVIVAVIFVLVYCKKRKINTLAIFDLLAPGLLIGQICGRWGNFFNQEAHGGPISEAAYSWMQYVIPPFIMKKMYIGGTYYHPTFLYEGLWNTIGFILILILRRKNKKIRIGDGIAFYLFWYGIGRACLIEPFRTDPLMFFDLRINIIVPALFAVVGVTWMVLKHTKYKAPYYIEYQKEIKENRIDGVICRLDNTLVDTSRLVKNAYYYTTKEYLNKDLSEEELNELLLVKPEKYYKDNLDALKAFETYFESNYSQIVLRQSCKDFFKTLFSHDYGVVVVTDYSKEFAEYVLNQLKIMTYVSIIVDKDNTTSNGIEDAYKCIEEKKHILVICDSKRDMEYANRLKLATCLVNYGVDYEEALKKKPTYIINKFTQLDDIIIE